MARLPSREDLSGALSLRSGRAYASADASAAGRGLSALGAGLANAGQEISAVEKQRKDQENVIAIANAEAFKTKGLLDGENLFQDDPDYKTFDKRAKDVSGKVIKDASQFINDPQMRDRWLANSQQDAIRFNDGVRDKGAGIARQANMTAFDNALETNRRLYVDPATPDDVKKKAKADIEGALASGLETGLLDPVEADKRRKMYIDEAEFSRAKLEVEKDPVRFVPRGEIANLITGKAEKYGVNPDVALGIAKIESGLRPDAKAGTSSAGGLFQFIDSTAANYGLRNKFDADENADAGVRLTRDNTIALTKSLGREPSPGEVYLAHFSGFGAAKKLGLASDDTPASEIFSPQAIRANASILAGKTAGQVRAWADRKMAKAISETGGQVPDYVKTLSPEQRADLDNFAQQRYQQMETEQAAMRTAAKSSEIDNYNLRIATGDIGLSQNDILANPVLDNGDKATLVNSLNTKMKEVNDTAAAVQAFASGGLRVDPYDAKGREKVDDVYGAVMKTVAPEQVQPMTEEIVRQTGVVPKQAMSIIRQGMASNNPVQIEQAAQAAQRLSSISPGALSRATGGESVQKMADDFDYYVNKLNLSPQNAAMRIQEANDPRKVVERKAIEPAAKQFVKSLGDFDIANEFDAGWFSSAPELGATPAQALGLQSEFAAIAEEQFFATNGDPELAKNRAVAQMKLLYGSSGLGGGVKAEGGYQSSSTSRNVLMRHPPENYWPKDPQSSTGNPHQYVIDSLIADVTAQEVDVVDGSIRLVSTPETDAMVKRNEVPSYAVMWQDKNGQIQTMPGKLWRPDFAKATANIEREKQERVQDARDLDTDIKAGRDRETSLYNFLNGSQLDLQGAMGGVE